MSEVTKHFNIKDLDKYFNRDTSKDLSLFLCNYEDMYQLEIVAKLIYDGVLSNDDMVGRLIEGESISGFQHDCAIFMNNAEVLYLVSKFSIDLTKRSQYAGFTFYDNPDWDKIVRNVNRIVNYLLTEYLIPENFDFEDDFKNQINTLREIWQSID